MSLVHAIVLTFNEQGHLARCLQSIAGVCYSILVVDSGSTDRTRDIAATFGAKVITNPFVNYAEQFNFGISQVHGDGGWILRIDADEVLVNPPREVFQTLDKAKCNIDGLLVRRRIHFMGRPMKWGGMDPIWQLRLWRQGSGMCESRWMDEHIVVQRDVQKSGLLIDDINLNSVTWWTDKHNRYASREAIDVVMRMYSTNHPEQGPPSLSRGQIAIKRAFKEHLYLHLPPGLRAVIYFVYRYIIRFGFLDGKAGWYFHVLQGLWYRTLVDAKVSEILRDVSIRKCALGDAIRHNTGIEIGKWN